MTTPSLRTASTWLRRVGATLRAPLWFPHVPLSLAFVLGGVWLLRADLGAGWYEFIVDVVTRQVELRPRLLPPMLIGTGMVIMGLGLMTRSRVALVMTALLALTGLGSLWFGVHSNGAVLAAYLGVCLVALFFAEDYFHRSSVTAGTLFALTSVVMLLLYATFGAYYLGGSFKPAIQDLVTALYFAIITTSTVGYGDITPVTSEAKLFTVSVVVFGVAVFTTSLTAVVAPLVTRSLQGIVNQGRKRMNREKHFVVVGNSALAWNTSRELAARGQPVTRVLKQQPPEGTVIDDLVVGDPGNVDTLKQAGVEKAQAVLAMMEDDSENAFVVLAVRELGSSTRTVVSVNDARHLGRVRLVQPDVVIAPQILGGELAAMVLCGEEVTSDFVMKRVLQQEKRSPETKGS